MKVPAVRCGLQRVQKTCYTFSLRFSFHITDNNAAAFQLQLQPQCSCSHSRTHSFWVSFSRSIHIKFSYSCSFGV